MKEKKYSLIWFLCFIEIFQYVNRVFTVEIVEAYAV